MASDSFTRANAPNLGANWTQINGIGPIAIVSNGASASSPAAGGEVWTADVFGNDQFSQATLAAAPGGAFTWGLVCVRVVDPAVNMSGYYGGFDRADYANDLYRIEKYSVFTQSTLAVHASQTALNGDVVKLTAVGTTLTLNVNGIDILSVVDASFASGAPGLSAVGNSSLFDNWSGAEAVPSAPSTLTAVAGNGSAALSWTANAAGESVTSYKVYTATALAGPYTLNQTVTTNSATVTGLTNGTLYYVEVTAVNAAGESAASTPYPVRPLLSGDAAAQQGSEATAGGSALAGGSQQPLEAGASFVIQGWKRCSDRVNRRILVHAAATGAFNLDLQTSGDEDRTIVYNAPQVASSTVAVDGGLAGFTEIAEIASEKVDYLYRVVLVNTSGGQIDYAYEVREFTSKP